MKYSTSEETQFNNLSLIKMNLERQITEATACGRRGVAAHLINALQDIELARALLQASKEVKGG